MGLIEKLKELDLRSSTPNDVRLLLAESNVLHVPFLVNKGVYILRGRKGGGYKKRSQMTYCPVEKCLSMQRATLANQTMFYGVISDEQSHQEKARAVVVGECSKLCRMGKESVGRETFSVSYWEVVKPLSMISLINDKTFHEVKDNLVLDQLRDAFNSLFGGEKSSDEDKNISRFINSEFCKVVNNDFEYLISATIATDIVKEKGVDGIFFPSVQFGGQAGINVALTTQAVNKKLRFRKILEQSLYKKGDKSIIRIEKVTENKKIYKQCQFPNYVIENELGIKISDLPCNL